MEPFLTGEDYTSIKDAVQEARSMSVVSVMVHRFLSFTGGNAAQGKSPTRTDTSIPTMMRVYALTQKDVLDSGGIYQLGDIKTHSILDVVGYNNAQANLTQGDKLTYDGNNYRVNGKPLKVNAAGGRVYTEAFWSKIQ
jgi:hypothetical protein